MANTLLIKGSKTSSAQPTLSYGADDGDGDAATEIAINRADGKLFYMDDSNQVTEFMSGVGGGTVSSGVAGTFAVYATNGTTVVDSDQQGTGEPDGSIYYDNTNYAILKLWREDGSSSGTNGFGSLYFGNTDYSSDHSLPNAVITCYGGGVTQSNSDGGANMSFQTIAAGTTTLSTRLKLSSTGDTVVQNGNFIVDGGNLYIEGDSSAPGQLRIYEDTDLGTNYTAFTVGTQAADITYTLPTDDGDDGEFLQTDGDGVLAWEAPVAYGSSGSGNINADNIGSGTLPMARLSGTLPALNASALTNLDATDLSGTLPALNASALTTINAAAISSGTLAVARAPPMVGAVNSTNSAGVAGITARPVDGDQYKVLTGGAAYVDNKDTTYAPIAVTGASAILRLTASGTGSGNQDITFAQSGGMTITATNPSTITFTSADTNTQLSTEAVQDIVGAMFTSNTETRIAATYEDGDGTIDLVVTDMTANDNTVDMGSGFVIEDGDGTEVTITENKEVKFIDGAGIDINWTDTSTGSDGDPYDLTFIVDHDAATNFVANEHLDWTASVGTIHSGNYTNTTYSVGDGGLTQNNFTNTLKSKLDGIAASANNYSLPSASLTVVGGVELATTSETTTGTDATRAATPAGVQAAIDALIGGAPGALDTLNELAAAISDDASYASTITTALALKSTIASPTFTGIVTTPDLTITDLPSHSSEATALVVASNVVGYRELGTNAFNSTTIATNNNQLTNGAGYITSYTNTVDMGSGFVLEDGDGTEVTITEDKEIKFIDGAGIDINWTDTSTGSDGDPYDLTFTVDHDAATNFVANEHLDWTASVGTIHSGNYTNTQYSVGDGGLTTNDFTNADHSKLNAIAASATNVTNNNQISNGAGYITSYTNTQLSTEQVQDIVGAMMVGTETRIGVTYDDSNGEIDFVVDDMTANDNTWRTVTAGGNTLSTSETLAFTAGTNVTITESGGAVTITSTDTNTNTQLSNEQVQDIVGAMFTSNTETRIAATYEDGDGTIDLVVTDMTANDNTWRTVTAGGNTLSTSETLAFTAGTNVTISESGGAVTITSADTNTTYSAGSNMSLSGTTFSSTDTNTQLSTEQVQDIVGAMLVGTETRIGVSYDDTNGEIDFVVDDMTANDNTWRTVTAGGNTLSTSETLAFGAGTGITIAESAGTVTITNSIADTTLSTEQVQDIVGAMFTSNTETRIAATYEDGDGTIDLVVTDMTANDNTWRTVTAGGNTLSTSETLAFTAGTNVTITESGGAVTITSADTNTTYSAGSNMALSGTTFSSTDTNTTYTAGDFITLTGTDFDVDVLDEDDLATDSATKLATQQSIKAYVDAGLAASGSGDVTGVTLASDSGSASDTTANVDLTIAGGTNVTTSATGTTVTINATDTNTTYSAGSNMSLSGTTFSATDTNTQLSTEQVQDIVGAMFTSNTETRATVTYQDGDGTIDVVVDDMTANDNTWRTVTAGGNTLSTSETLAFTAGTNVTITESAGAVTITSADTNTQYSVGDGGLTTNDFTNADHSKLNAIEASATADQSNSEIKTAVEAASSIALGGSPTTSTQSANDNSTKVATTAFVQTEITDLIGGAPGALDTLNELAAAIGDDASYASTITTALGLKSTIASPTFTGIVTTPDLTITDLPSHSSEATALVVASNVIGYRELGTNAFNSTTIATNNNQLTNGAGYITSYTNTQLSTENVQDIVGAMFTSNTETRATVTYQDGDGTIDVVVDDMTANDNTWRTVTAGGNTLSTSETLAFTAGTNVTITESGGAVTITSTDTNTNTQLSNEQVQDIVGAMFTSNTETRIAATYQDGDGTIDLVVTDMTANDNTWRTVTAGGNTLSTSETLAFTAGTNVTISESGGAVTITSADTNTTYSAGSNMSLSGTTFSATDTNTQLSTEQVQDIVGAMFTSNTETRATVTYQDGDGTIDVVVDDMTGGGGEDNEDSFKTISVSGQSDVVADSTTDTLTFVAAGGMTITTAAGSDTITLSSADTNTQLSTENVQDIVGAMFTSNTETRIAATYEDGDGTIDLVVTDMTANDNTWRTVTAGGNTLSTSETLAFTAGTNVTITESGGAVTITSADTNTTYSAGSNMSLSGTTFSATDTNTQLSTEQVQDIVGAMFTSNTETRIAATYEDGDGTIDLVVTDMTANDNTTYSAGNLLDLSSTTFHVDLSELTDGTSTIVGSQDELVYLDNGSQKRKLISEITLSDFSNDSGWTTNTGTTTASNSQTFTNKAGNISQWTNNSGYITSYTNTTYSAGNLLDLSSTTFHVDLSELTDGTSDITSDDEVVYLDNGSQKRKAFSELKLSQFNNNSGWTSNTGDITAVTAGSGMSGGGTSGGVTLTNAGVTSIVAGSNISISGATGAVTVTASDNNTTYSAGTGIDIVGGGNAITIEGASINEGMLDVSNSPSDNQILSYNSAGSNFTWIDDATGGGGGNADTLTVADTTDTTCYVGLWESATGPLAGKTDGSLTYNAGTGALVATSFVGALTGAASEALILKNARTIAGVSFDGSANISLNNNAISNGAGYVTSNTTYSAGSLLDLSSTTFNVDLSELTDGTADVVGSADELVYLDNGSQKRKQINEIKLGQFNNDQGWVTSAGVTSNVAGNAITISGATGAVTINHEDTSSQASVNNSGTTAIQDITLDTYGHVTSITSANVGGGGGGVNVGTGAANDRIAIWENSGDIGGQSNATIDSSGNAAFGGTITSSIAQVCDRVTSTQTMALTHGALLTMSAGYASLDFFSPPSDERLKTGITTLEYGLNEIKAITPKWYKFDESSFTASGLTNAIATGEHKDAYFDLQRYGLMAGDVKTVMPKLVSKLEDDKDYETYDKDALIFVLINAVKELEARLTTLEAA